MGGCGGCKQQKDGSAVAVQEKPLGPGEADERIVNMRFELCNLCDEVVQKDDGTATNRRLFGEFRGHQWCGNPNDARTKFNPEKFGLGRRLDLETAHRDAACPRGKWGPGDAFARGIIPVYVTAEKPGQVEEGVIDYIGPTRTKDNVTDCTGIGDTLVQSVVCQALRRERPKHKVRFCTLSGRVEWARFGNHSDDVDSIDRPNRIPGEHAMHSARMLAVEIDATARMRGQCRQQVLAQMAGLPPESVSSWDYDIPQHQRDHAAEFLEHPLREERPIVSLAPQCKSPSRQWPIRHWVHLGDMLKREGLAVFILAEPIPEGVAHWIKGIPFRRFNSNDPLAIAAVVEKADLLVSNDSGMAHLAGFVGTKATAVCGATDGQVAFGGWPTVRPIQAPGPCTACLWFQDGGWQPWCSYGCETMQTLKPGDVKRVSLQYMSE